jgi:hypothetical protein
MLLSEQRRTVLVRQHAAKENIVVVSGKTGSAQLPKPLRRCLRDSPAALEFLRNDLHQPAKINLPAAQSIRVDRTGTIRWTPKVSTCAFLSIDGAYFRKVPAMAVRAWQGFGWGCRTQETAVNPRFKKFWRPMIDFVRKKQRWRTFCPFQNRR